MTLWILFALKQQSIKQGWARNRDGLETYTKLQTSEYGDLVDDALRDAQPVQADQRFCNMIEASKSIIKNII